MVDVDPTPFDEFWRYVAIQEDFIKQYGAVRLAPVEVEDKWDKQFEALYEAIAPALEKLPKSQSEKPMFTAPPSLPGANAFAADNAHQALMYVLNPPEGWFGSIGALDSPEYREIKKAAHRELRQLGLTSDTIHLNENERLVLSVIDETPRMSPAIADKVGISEDTARHILANLKKLGHIKNLPKKGYVRD